MRRYGFRMFVIPQEWGRFGADFHVEQFRRDADRNAKSNGYPAPRTAASVEIVGLRLNSEGARDDRGELPPRIECEPDDPRVVEIEMRIGWRA